MPIHIPRTEIAAAFAAAKPYLFHTHMQVGYGSIFICYALEKAYNCGALRHSAMIAAQRVVHERLAGAPSIEAWLFKRRYISSIDFVPSAVRDEIQAYRHRWLDALIEEFKGETQ